MNYYNNYAPNNFANRYALQQPAYGREARREQYEQYAPQRQEQPIGQGFAFGANNFFGAGSSFLGNQFGQQAGGAGYNQFGGGSNFTSPSSFFGGGQNASQQAGIYNGGNTMNVNFGSQTVAAAPRYEMPRYEAPRYEMPRRREEYCAPRQQHTPYIPAQPMPQPPVVPAPYCPPPAPPVVVPQKPDCDYPPIKPPVQPPAPPVQSNFVGLAGDPVGYGQDLAGKTVDAPQNTGYHNLYANGEGFAGNAAGGQLAGILNRQQPLTAFGTAVQDANAQGLYQGGVPAGGIAVNSLTEKLNAKDASVANTQYGVSVGDYKVQLAGGLTQVIKPDGSTVTLKPDGSEFKIGDLATLRAGVTLPGSGEARTVLAYNEKLKDGGTSKDLLTWGFRMPDGLGATERASAGFSDGVQRLDSNGNKNYYDFQVIQNAQPNQVG
jgi:hypothetical protein